MHNSGQEFPALPRQERQYSKTKHLQIELQAFTSSSTVTVWGLQTLVLSVGISHTNRGFSFRSVHFLAVCKHTLLQSEQLST